mgnify:CR=1 FL=1
MPSAQARFEVRRTPQGPLELGDTQAMHMRFDKTFEGPLVATSVVHMLAVGTAVEGSAGYVALERLEATLDGRAGRFSMMHFGVMDRGTPSLKLEVVPRLGRRRTHRAARLDARRHHRRRALLYVRLRAAAGLIDAPNEAADARAPAFRIGYAVAGRLTSSRARPFPPAAAAPGRLPA